MAGKRPILLVKQYRVTCTKLSSLVVCPCHGYLLCVGQPVLLSQLSVRALALLVAFCSSLAYIALSNDANAL